ncbi:arginine N-methyltransferase skb1 [Pseudomassariella vexata]|uniref:Protein arginine N-methyltransferase n=1 Tax=Pseudomassariella vexata TaxID=1141098 RepID=A0A1Y2DY41_9PEZI|nr:arginine N-methyltransferase skb1 [Pseudomassariella vexata]ORY64129.1 arginine N-methyltransferase skb1 [Pseudomassariella vexata]
MAPSYSDLESDEYDETRPVFYIGQHDSSRTESLTDLQYGQILNAGFSFVTTPITNETFHKRIENLAASSITELQNSDIPSCHPDPIVPPLTIEDTTLFPSNYTGGLVAYSSPWIDLCSPNPVISSISRQVLNLEVSYANFCGVRSIVIPGPRHDAAKAGTGQGIAQFARAIQEAILVGTRVNFIIHLPMYREPGLEERVDLLLATGKSTNGIETREEIDLFSAWDSWHVIRSTCNYDARLSVALRIPHMLPEKELQTRWFAEPLQYLTFCPRAFQTNRTGHPSLTRHHQDLIMTYMRLKNAPYFLLCDVGPEVQDDPSTPEILSADNFPTLAEAAEQPAKTNQKLPQSNPYASYLRHVERQQEPLSALEQSTLANFQDWLQSPLQPLSDNLESITYEVFEGDPVKYNQYEGAITQALEEWSRDKKPTSSSSGAVVIAVAGSGRGPLVTRALKASETTGVPVEVWAVEKNPNAYVYLLRQNQRQWGGRVTVVKTDMRAWKGPLISGLAEDNPVYGNVDILVSELLGSFGDNELSPECLDGIQHVLAKPHGISIPKSYTAHLSPISTPRIHADISQRLPLDVNAFETPWVVRLFQLDFVAQRVPGHARFQQAWEFVHPLPQSTMDMVEARRSGGVVGGGGGSMAGGVGANDHNSRHCHLTFVCRARGIIHGLAGYFESVLYAPTAEGKEPVELSILPDMIDRKSKDMISWFPIFFPLKQPLYFPPDTELEVSMWRQTDDTKVWYEWMVEAFTWVGPKQRVKVGASEMCSSRKMACLM